MTEADSIISVQEKVDIVDANGRTPLHIASQTGQVTIAEELIFHGADVNARDSNDNTPLHMSSEAGYVDTVRLLIDNSSRVNDKNTQLVTPLYLAAYRGHISVVRLLLDHGADIDAPNTRLITPLMVAAIHGHDGVAALLVERGASISDHPVYPDATGAAHRAAAAYYEENGNRELAIQHYGSASDYYSEAASKFQSLAQNAPSKAKSSLVLDSLMYAFKGLAGDYTPFRGGFTDSVNENTSYRRQAAEFHTWAQYCAERANKLGQAEKILK